MTLRELLSLVAPARLADADPLPLHDALHDSEGSEAPLLVRAFSAIGTWIGAAMLAVIFIALEIYEVLPLALALGLGLFVGATLLSRRPGLSLAMTQLVWAMALGGHGLLAAAAFELHIDETAMLLIWTGLNVATVFMIRVTSFQLASAVCAVGFATAASAVLELPMYPLWVALPVAAIATAAWIYEVAWAGRLGRTWAALAYGLPIGVAGPLTLTSADPNGPGWVAQGWGAPVATLMLLGLIAAVLVQARREQELPIDARAYALGIVGVLAVLAARNVPGLGLSLLWLLLAHLRRSRGLQVIAMVQLAGFLVFFYYQLETTLLLKSLWVLSTGALLLVSAWLARPRDDAEPGSSEAPTRRWKPALALIILSCALVIVPTLHKQRLLETGHTLLLPLAPVDPRSLMQGDYMELRYELERDVQAATKLEAGALPRGGCLILSLEPDGSAHFVRLDEGGVLAADERRIQYRVREDWGASLRVGAESFFFAEGDAYIYEQARYGEVIVADDGEALLVGLRDAQRRPLGQRLHASSE